VPLSASHGTVEAGTSQATDAKPRRKAESAGGNAEALERQVSSHTAGTTRAPVRGPAVRSQREWPMLPVHQENRKGGTFVKTTMILALLVLASAAQAQEEMTQEDPADGHCEMMKRGGKGMGFSQQTTTHHFRLLPDGGAIEIATNDPNDTATRDQIRQHLSQVAKMFSHGNFQIPMFIHGRTPPGVPTMAELRDQIHDDFEPMESGGRVRIHTGNTRAAQSVHEFLRFQIMEHRTGDPISPPNGSAK
jgi:hypothetical protein